VENRIQRDLYSAFLIKI